ncbi:MAG: hypothetical protein U0X76_10135 [Bacteroidia bacterium]
MENSPQNKIVDLLKEKISLKQEVYSKTKDAFFRLKKILGEMASDLQTKVKHIDKDLTVDFHENGEFEVSFTLADETLLFVMHTNIFTFDSSSLIWKQPYVQQDKNRSYCGKIFIYNFLADSFRYNRINDLGYLIGRIFINREGHFFVEGRKQMGYLYNDFASAELNEEALMKIVEAAVMFTLDFDPFTPPFEQQGEITVRDVNDAGVQARITTGKRLGFRFQSDDRSTF